jgi:hypothetical protein
MNVCVRVCGCARDSIILQIEFNYAKSRKSASRMVAVPMEPRCLDPGKWDGPVGAVLGPRLYPANFAFKLPDEGKLATNVAALADAILKLCAEINDY